MNTHRFPAVANVTAVLFFTVASLLAQTSPPAGLTNRTASSAGQLGTNNVISRIREEGLERSQVMQTLSQITDVLGPRLTGSPELKRANEWTRDQLVGLGLANAQLEAWGPFGRGWSLQRFSVQVIAPYAFPVIAYPKAWSPGLQQPIEAEVVYLDAQGEADLDKYRGKLKGAIVLLSAPREVSPRLEPLAYRWGETNLLRLANASDPNLAEEELGAPRFAGRRRTNSVPVGLGTNRLAGVPPREGGRSQLGAGRALGFLLEEGAALAVSSSSQADGGTVFVTSATLPSGGGFGGGARVWSTNAPATVPQIALAVEDYNRLVRMTQRGVRPRIAVEFAARFHDEDLMSYNTVAEITGTDLKDEIVMVGAHLDSWQAGTGAADNGAGVAACMEALRIIKTLGLAPRRTIRIGLWSGEEQGLLGSRAYVTEHLGYYTNTAAEVLRSPRAAAAEEAPAVRASSTNAPVRRLVRLKEHERFSAYFNLDNGGGRIRGIYLQGNEALRPRFRDWLKPFADLGADTVTLANTSGTDHSSFDRIGLPGFQFIQDPLDYWSRVHHSSQDVYERVPADDLKQASTILATFAYQAAMLEQRLPRKPTDEPRN